MNNSKKLFGANIITKCEYCQHCITESGTEFCKARKSINAKGKCSKFEYNPTMRKVNLKILDSYNKEDFSL